MFSRYPKDAGSTNGEAMMLGVRDSSPGTDERTFGITGPEPLPTREFGASGPGVTQLAKGLLPKHSSPRLPPHYFDILRARGCRMSAPKRSAAAAFLM
jgi:hypothetical protein